MTSSANSRVVAADMAPAVRTLLERLDAPAASTLMGLGAVPGDDPRHLGLLGMHGTYAANRATAHADVLLGLGLRFDDRVTGATRHFAPRARIVHCDIDLAEIGKVVRADVPVLGDLRETLPLLLEALPAAPAGAVLEARRAWWGELRGWEERQGWSWATPLPLGGEGGEPLLPQAVLQAVSRAAGDDAVVVTDVGQHQMWTALLHPLREPRRLVTSVGLGTMGFGLPAALGAQMAGGDRPVWLVTGDGSIQMNVQEMATAVSYGLPVRVVIVNNHQLGMVRQWQELFHQERYSAVAMSGQPDWALLAAAYGWQGRRVTARSELRPALDMARDAQGPVLLDIWVRPQENVFPMVPAGAALHEVLLQKPAEGE